MLLILWICLLLFPASGLAKNFSWEYPRVEIRAVVNVSKHQIQGEARIELPPRKVVWINVQNLALKSVRLASKRLIPEMEEGFFRVMATAPGQELKIEYAARFPAYGRNHISKKGIFLVDNWAPSIKGLAFYNLWVTVPKRFKAVAPADKIRVTRRSASFYHFYFPHPSTPPPLIATRFFYFEENKHGLTVSVYLLKKDPKLAKIYQKKAFSYIKAYSKLLGKYPYKRFSIVENFMEIGCAFPTIAVFGSKILRLPFIPETSLPHEILHNWFGNGVYVQEEEGNWCEGLVTYLADYKQAARKREGIEFRHRLLLNYQTYVSPEKEFPLKEFRGRYDRASQAIGYFKGCMLFYMLEEQVGKEKFFQSLKNFYKEYLFYEASWKDIQKVFEKVSSKDLSTFFSQWVSRPGLPVLHLLKGRIVTLKKGKKYLVGLTITQKEPYYHLQVPLEIISEKETKHLKVNISGSRTRIDIKIKGKPLKASLDPTYSIARHLSEKEIPPVLARIWEKKKGIMVLLKKRDIMIYRPLVTFLQKKDFALDTENIEPQSTNYNLIYLGEIPKSLKPLFSKNFSKNKDQGFCIEVRENPLNQRLIIARAWAKNMEEIELCISKLPHLGDYQKICAKKGKITEKMAAVYEHGIQVVLTPESQGISLKELSSLDNIARAVSLNKVIFIGEEHDRYGDHLAQLEIIKWLQEHGHKIAIGMEMFQRPFQKGIDAYISGKISEEEFLKRTEYFDRWGYNWKIYKPILDFAKKHQIPVIALNLPRELTKKVAQKGINSLTEEEKKLLPSIDFNNLAYKEYLKKIYQEHSFQGKKIKDFESFYQAQLLWDEGMAETIVSYLKKHPDRQMIVLAGKEHVMYGYGIPSRIARRGINAYQILITAGEETLDPGMADYIIFPVSQEAPFFAHLGVLIEQTSKGLKVARVLPDTPAQRGGLKKGDIILKADGREIKTIGDLKLVLYKKAPKDKIKLEIKRGAVTKNIVIGPFKEKK